MGLLNMYEKNRKNKNFDIICTFEYIDPLDDLFVIQFLWGKKFRLTYLKLYIFLNNNGNIDTPENLGICNNM